MKKRTALFSVCGSLYILAFFAVTNFFNTEYPWFLFCVPPVLMWPVCVCSAFFLKKKLSAAFFGWVVTIVFSAYYIILNIYLSAGFSWSFIVVSALLWYPFSVMLAEKVFPYSVFGFFWAVFFFSGLNYITTPDVIWAVYPIFAMFWWPLSVFFFGNKIKCNNKKGS